jgi:predicted unusual protein kinase regulating ubiquinone biosynthesis (AarF/ABC1/UbiB family)
MYRARYRRIVWFFGRAIASIVFWDVFITRIGLGDWSARNRPERMRKIAIRFRKLAISMGGVMIKVGQFLSTRVDILPREVTSELSGLQDEVPPVPFEAIWNVIETEFTIAPKELFLDFQPVPLAAASLGQVHRATILQSSPKPATTGSQSQAISGNGHHGAPERIDVVVKVQRPDIENLIKTDLEALRTVGRWLQRYKPIRRRADVQALLDEFSRILYQEIDYLAEGRNAEKFASNFSGNRRVRVPKVYWTHTTVRVLTLENVFAIKIADYEAISRANINRNEVASLLLDTYFQQIFEDGFFHADPHPGNLFVEPSPESVLAKISSNIAGDFETAVNRQPAIRWQLTFVDFGMVGHVPPNMRSGLRELVIGVGTRDTQRVVKAYQQMGILLPGADLAMLERASSRVFEQYWGKSMSELANLNTNDLKVFLDEFRDLVFDLPFQIPQDLIFLVRCVNILSGICTGLDPQFNVFDHLMPYAQKLISDEARNNRRDWLSELEQMARSWLNAPLKLDSLITRLERGDLTMRNPEVSQQVNHLERTTRSLSFGIIFAAFLLGGIQMVLGGFDVWGGVLLGGAAITLFWIIWKNMTSF